MLRYLLTYLLKVNKYLSLQNSVLAFRLFCVRLFRVRVIRIRLIRVRLIRIRLFRFCLIRLHLFRVSLIRVCIFRVCLFRVCLFRIRLLVCKLVHRRYIFFVSLQTGSSSIYILTRFSFSLQICYPFAYIYVRAKIFPQDKQLHAKHSGF